MEQPCSQRGQDLGAVRRTDGCQEGRRSERPGPTGDTIAGSLPGVTHQGRDDRGPTGFTKDGDRVEVTPKGGDIPLHPAQSSHDVEESPVARSVLIPSAGGWVGQWLGLAGPPDRSSSASEVLL